MSVKYTMINESVLNFTFSPSCSVVAYTDPSGDFFDKIGTYHYNDNPVTKMPNGHLYKGQEKYNKESHLYDLLSTEKTMLHGIVLEYYVTTYDRTANPLFGEDSNRRVIRKFDVMADIIDLPQHDNTIDIFGIGVLNVGELKIPMRHFYYASQKASGIADDQLGTDQGFLVDMSKTYASTSPKISDVIKLKSDNVFYEIVYVDDKETFLQRRHEWVIKFRKFRDDQMTVSDEEGQKELMSDLSAVSDRRGDEELFDVKSFLLNNRTKTHYNDNEEIEKPELDDAWGSKSINDWFKQ